MLDVKGKRALVTGAGGGIGKQIALDLAGKGCYVTVADVHGESADLVAAEIRGQGGSAQSFQCDVSDDQAQARMFQEHCKRAGGLDIAVLNAGISEPGHFLSAGSAWQKTLDVDLRAVIVGTQLAARYIGDRRSQSAKGVILLNASAGGLFPMPYSPVYAAAKAGVVNFARSITSQLSKRGIRIGAVCPQPVDTPLAHQAIGVKGAQQFTDMAAKMLSVKQVSAAFLYLIENEDRNGTILLLHSLLQKAFEWHEPRGNLKPVDIPELSGSKQAPEQQEQLAQWVRRDVPAELQGTQVHKLSIDFREATRIVRQPLEVSAPPGQVLMRRVWAGVNASDINFTAGRYLGGAKEAQKRLPFWAGFEAVGVIAAVGDGVAGLQVGQPVAELGYGCFSDWGLLKAATAIPIPRPAPEVVALLTSGLTASIGLEVAGRMRSKETVLVTAAAGGTGQFAVQLAKAAGNTVVATCSSADKAALLKRLGANRVINYRSEDVGAVLRKEYPRGIDVVYESVGGAMLEACVRNLAIGGRLVVIGMVSQYTAGWAPSQVKGLPERLLTKGATMAGFFLPQHFSKVKSHLPRLVHAWEQGRLQVSIDPTLFAGLEAVPDAVDRLLSGRSVGKVVVQLAPTLPPFAADARL